MQGYILNVFLGGEGNFFLHTVLFLISDAVHYCLLAGFDTVVRGGWYFGI